ncbi:hypothetical protein GCM10022240_14890 [Microbacterium kribbense]|uniref:Uncharacterized protein n=1 Tax=Microbacterium kribbense TaxID=433645 RepID=A0ABP7GET5_9MICO
MIEGLVLQRAPHSPGGLGIHIDTAADSLIATGDDSALIKSGAAFLAPPEYGHLQQTRRISAKHRTNRHLHQHPNAALGRPLIVSKKLHEHTLAYTPHRPANGNNSV